MASNEIRIWHSAISATRKFEHTLVTYKHSQRLTFDNDKLLYFLQVVLASESTRRWFIQAGKDLVSKFLKKADKVSYIQCLSSLLNVSSRHNRRLRKRWRTRGGLSFM